jgi:hypothetical protein
MVMTRAVIITDDGVYEGWGRDRSEVSEKVRTQIGDIPHVVLPYFPAPDWLTLKVWDKLMSLCRQERVAIGWIGALDAALGH